mmetsp:Transcript_43219/g.111313  ORF Transcript_43219/g.111313 Transcript_43219/m.111313 type:complete len:107 (+) Transcript_43219:3-323(+)
MDEAKVVRPNSAFGCNTGPSDKQLSIQLPEPVTSVGGNTQAMQEKLAEHLSMHYRMCSPGLGQSGSDPTRGLRRLTGGVRRLLQCDGLACRVLQPLGFDLRLPTTR